MTVGLLVIAHDKTGSTLIDTAVSLVGTCPLKVESLEIYKDSNADDAVNKALELVKLLDEGDGVLVLTDLYGSTPSNITSKLKNINNLIIISGVNLPMLMRSFNYHSLNLSELSEKALDGGRNGILICN